MNIILLFENYLNCDWNSLSYVKQSFWTVNIVLHFETYVICDWNCLILNSHFELWISSCNLKLISTVTEIVRFILNSHFELWISSCNLKLISTVTEIVLFYLKQSFWTVNPLEGKCPERATSSRKWIFFLKNWRSRFRPMSCATMRKKKKEKKKKSTTGSHTTPWNRVLP